MKSNYFGPPCQTVQALLKTAAAAVLICVALAGAYGQSVFSKGEDLFLRNRPQEAIPLLEAALAEDGAHVVAALYLGIAYQQSDRHDDAVAVFRRILPRAGDKTALVAFNLGNAYFAKGGASFAIQYYTQALQADPNYASAYLNRANARVKMGAVQESTADYEQFLALEPSSPKRPQIEQLLALIRGEAAAAERARESAAAEAKAEEDRRRRLLEEVAASLQSAAEETRGLQAGAEEVLSYDGEFELE